MKRKVLSLQQKSSMIPLKQLREDKAAIIEGLQKRNFKEIELIDTFCLWMKNDAKHKQRSINN